MLEIASRDGDKSTRLKNSEKEWVTNKKKLSSRFSTTFLTEDKTLKSDKLLPSSDKTEESSKFKETSSRDS